MATVADITERLEQIAPPHLAEEWDNTGLLLGDRSATVARAMTCLTITPDSAAEAVDERADLIITHHPLPFRPLKRITTDTTEGAMLWQLARAGVAIYSPHTSFDSAAEGINQQLAVGLGLNAIEPLTPAADDPSLGSGRIGATADGVTIAEVAERLKAMLAIDSVRLVGDPGRAAERISLACGSGGSLLDGAIAAGCDTLVTGEATFHTCLAAEARGVAMLLVGHYASERFAVETLADRLAAEQPGVEFWPSRREKDPLRVV